MKKEWLNKKITVEQAEIDFLLQDERVGPEPVPFGFYNQLWKQMKSELQEDDELWLFSSPKEAWMNMCGRGGICIVRDGEVYEYVVTMMN